jgi:hypothetical protein
VRRSVGLLAALAAGAALFATGCGDDAPAGDTTTAAGASGPTTPSGVPPSRPEFIAQADAICRRTSRELDRAGEEAFQGAPSLEVVERYVADEFVPATRAELAEIRELAPPAGDEADVDAILDAAEGAVEALADDPSLFERGSPFSEANRLAADYGFEACGQ